MKNRGLGDYVNGCSGDYHLKPEFCNFVLIRRKNPRDKYRALMFCSNCGSSYYRMMDNQEAEEFEREIRETKINFYQSLYIIHHLFCIQEA